MPVHLYGQCANMDSILEVARRHGLAVIEDAAQAIGSEYKGQRAGSIGDYGCLSFFPTKNLGGFGDGGMVTMSSKELYDRVKILRVHGSEPKYSTKQSVATSGSTPFRPPSFSLNSAAWTIGQSCGGKTLKPTKRSLRKEAFLIVWNFLAKPLPGTSTTSTSYALKTLGMIYDNF